MSLKYKQTIYHGNVNVKLTVENINRVIKTGIMINVDGSVKFQRSIVYVKSLYLESYYNLESYYM